MIQEFHNPKNFRHLFVFSLLSGKNLCLTKDEEFFNYELKFLELLSVVTKGSKIFVTNKNKKIEFKPGSIEQDHFEYSPEFDCGNTRSIAYFLEPLFLIGLYSKNHLEINFLGITNDNIDFSVDVLKNSLIPFLHEILHEQKHFEIKIIERGFRPSGKGKIEFKAYGIKKTLNQIIMNKKKLIKRIRGTAMCSKVSLDFLNKIINKTRSIFNDYIPDVWIYSELIKNKNEHFYGISLNTNNFIPAEYCYDSLQESVISPEEIAEKAAQQLLEEIMHSSSVINTSFQSYALIMMALSEKKVSHIIIGRLSQTSVWIIRELKVFFDVMFNFESDQEKEGQTHIRCVGCGLVNRNVENN